MTETLTLPLGQRSYGIHIGGGLLEDGDLLRQELGDASAFVVTSETVAGLYLDVVRAHLGNACLGEYIMPDGEEHKNLGTLGTIVEALIESGANRTTRIVALGGGVVGDTAGFAAAAYQRGLDFVQIPTTLLAQVDSSVGGKTAVNHLLGKNMIGAFHQPRAVIIDTDTLRSLPPRELSAGLAEVIKHGMLGDGDYFDFVEQNLGAIRDLAPEPMARTIRVSCEIKARIVAEDERESGKRALLNLGHTFGHAIETGVGHGEWLHGEAVGAGLVMAADLSLRLGRCSAADASRVKQLIAAAGLPVAPPQSMTQDQFLELMARDKKVRDGGIRLILLDGGLGAAAVVDDVPPATLAETLRAGDQLCEGA